MKRIIQFFTQIFSFLASLRAPSKHSSEVNGETIMEESWVLPEIKVK